MDTIKVSDLKPVDETLGRGISKFIRSELAKLNAQEAVKLSDFAATVMEHCPTVKDKSQAYARISFVLKKASGFARLEKDGTRYIGNILPADKAKTEEESN